MRILQILQNTSTTKFILHFSFLFDPEIKLWSLLASRFKEVRILQSNPLPSTTLAKLFSNNRDSREFTLTNLRHDRRPNRYADPFICHALAIETHAAAGNLAHGI